MKSYWYQRASTWVSAAVLVGGLVSASLLFFVYKVETDFQTANASLDNELSAFLEGKGY